MIGLVLNLLNSIFRKTEDMAKITPYISYSDIFGNGTIDVVITTPITIEDLYNQYKTLEFRNVTITQSGSLKPKVNFGGDNGWVSQPNEFHPLYLKCSGTLTVEGELSAQGCGGVSSYYNGDCHVSQIVNSPVALVNYNRDGGGLSADPINVTRLVEYGKGGSFFKFKDLLLCGGGGGGNHRYTRGKWGHHHEAKAHMLGMANGGTWEGSAEGQKNCVYGCAGGFVGLYFSDLIINGVPYGTAGCDITRISANGYHDIRGAYEGNGGGTLVVAAKTIKLSGNGTINADGSGGCTYTVFSNTGRTYTAGNNKGSRGVRPSFLNNFPALGPGQTGYHWDSSTNKYVNGQQLGMYYFDDGSGKGIPTSYMACDTTTGCGGAGIVIGYKVSTELITEQTKHETKDVTYFGWAGYHTPYYAWTYTYGATYIVYTDSPSPIPGSFLVGTVPVGFTNQISSIGDSTVTVLKTTGEECVFTRNSAYDSGKSVDDRFIIYTKTTAPIVGTKTYDAPNNKPTGYVSSLQTNGSSVSQISDGVRWFNRSSGADQKVLE